MAIPPWVGSVGTGDGLGHRYKKRRVLCNSDPSHTGIVG